LHLSPLPVDYSISLLNYFCLLLNLSILLLELGVLLLELVILPLELDIPLLKLAISLLQPSPALLMVIGDEKATVHAVQSTLKSKLANSVPYIQDDMNVTRTRSAYEYYRVGCHLHTYLKLLLKMFILCILLPECLHHAHLRHIHLHKLATISSLNLSSHCLQLSQYLLSRGSSGWSIL